MTRVQRFDGQYPILDCFSAAQALVERDTARTAQSPEHLQAALDGQVKLAIATGDVRVFRALSESLAATLRKEFPEDGRGPVADSPRATTGMRRAEILDELKIYGDAGFDATGRSDEYLAGRLASIKTQNPIITAKIAADQRGARERQQAQDEIAALKSGRPVPARSAPAAHYDADDPSLSPIENAIRAQRRRGEREREAANQHMDDLRAGRAVPQIVSADEAAIDVADRGPVSPIERARLGARDRQVAADHVARESLDKIRRGY
jgi:hypothetical protein